jgi:hypothetical protein
MKNVVVVRICNSEGGNIELTIKHVFVYSFMNYLGMISVIQTTCQQKMDD